VIRGLFIVGAFMALMAVNTLAIYLTCVGQERGGFALFLAVCGDFFLIMYVATKKERNTLKTHEND